MVGKTGCGRSSLINKVTGKDYLKVLFSFSTVHGTPQHVHTELLINNTKYQCNFIEVPDLYSNPYRSKPISYHVEQMVKSNLGMYLQSVNLIIMCTSGRLGSFVEEIVEEIGQIYTKFTKNTKILALVITHCDQLRPNAIARRVEEFKSDERAKDIVASLGKGIHTVGFPDLFDIKPEHRESRKDEMQKDVLKLHRLIEESNDSVDVLKEHSHRCPIM